MINTKHDYSYCPCWCEPCIEETSKGSCEGDGGECRYPADENEWRKCKSFATGCLQCVNTFCERYPNKIVNKSVKEVLKKIVEYIDENRYSRDILNGGWDECIDPDNLLKYIKDLEGEFDDR